MPTLPSGLPEHVADDEDLARFLTSSSHYNSTMARPNAFLPEPEDRESSVFRHGSEPVESLWSIGLEFAAQGRNLHGAAILKAHQIRAANLAVIAHEPPARHAAIRNWPWIENDPVLQKAQQKEIAIELVSKAQLFRK